MRRTDEGGGAYGEDPYGDAGHAGRRRRRVRRAARLLVIPIGGYVALLLNTMLGGPGAGLRSSRSAVGTVRRPS
ncbi:hypothetical protein ACFVRU_16170, partial [Streptomyces sp. NPDC057927]